MVKYFSAMVEETPSGKKWALRSLQCWPILISRAKSKSILTYGDLANLINFPYPNLLSDILGHMLSFCKKNDLPLLNSIVVDKTTGIPGEGAELKAEQVPAIQMKVFAFDWFDIIPPTIEELKEAFDFYYKS
ncbi:MAG: hypothetical protein FJ126_06935 [Deltaproteobacteria bacterium]|nr:hypothetical protein [Deltaproteobacteria bacterium]